MIEDKRHVWNGWGPRVMPTSELIYTVHHSVTGEQTTFESIHNYHAGLGWGGFGYTYGVWADGRVVIAGDIDRARSCVKNQNHQALCAVVIGDLTGRYPSDMAINSLGWLYRLCREGAGIQPEILGHKDWAKQGTACPGDLWPAWRHLIVEASLRAAIAPEDYRLLGV